VAGFLLKEVQQCGGAEPMTLISSRGKEDSTLA
jgi:hypothetical protein